MTPKRTIVVAVAVAVGVAASVLSYVFLNNAQQRAYHNAKLVQAYVVVKPVPATLDGSAASIAGKQAVSTFGVGQVLVASMFASSSTGSNFTQLIPAGEVAVTASVDQV